VAQKYEQTRLVLPTAEELMPRVREMLRNLEATLRSDVALARMAIGALLGEGRLRIYRDGRFEGLATLSPEKLAAPRVAPGAARPCGSGGAATPETSRASYAAAAARCGACGATRCVAARLRGAAIVLMASSGRGRVRAYIAAS
jgi:hypothetical protein